MRDVTVELKHLRLHGMASAWPKFPEEAAIIILFGTRDATL